jgi:hypothetical protein
MEALLVAFEKSERLDQTGAASPASLPTVRHRAFTRHWLAADEGGAELMTAAFGTAARQAPPRAATVAVRSQPTPPPFPERRRGMAPASGRLKATLALLLLTLTILFAEPAASLIGRF